MRARRAALPKFVHDLFENAPSITAPPRALQQINVQMRGISLVWLRTEIIRVVIPMVNLLDPSPLARIALRLGKMGAQIRTPFLLVASEEGMRIEGAQCVAADALFVLQDETQVWLVG